jgi:uncharacterized protein YbjT (DUF2867 family)
MNQTGPVLVAGATGQTGRLIVNALLGQGYAVRALLRNASKAETLPAAVQCVVADLREPAALVVAATGVSAVISAIGGRAPFGPNGFRRIDWEGNRALIDAASSVQAPRFLMITAGSAGRAGFPYSLRFAPYPWKARAETHLQASGLPYTILAPGGLTDGPAAAQGVRLAPRAAYRTGRVTRSDLALVTVACLQEPLTISQTLTVVNDAALPPYGWRATLQAQLPGG